MTIPDCVLARLQKMEFRIDPNYQNPKTGLGTLHMWWNEVQGFCVCGKKHRDDEKLKLLTHEEAREARATLCGRCEWNEPFLREYLGIPKRGFT